MAVVGQSLKSSFWRDLSLDPTSGVKLVNHKLHLCFAPYYLKDLKKSVQSVIEARRNRYEEELGGILAGYGKISLLKPEAETLFNLSDIHVDVEGEFYIFNPVVGQELVGIVNRKSFSYIGCLVHGLFNVSLPKPENLQIHEWPGKSANLQDQVKFTVTELELRSQVPRIVGDIIELSLTEVSLARKWSSCSDSGVSVASVDEESSSGSIEEEKMMDKKRSKLSLTYRKNEAKISTPSKTKVKSKEGTNQSVPDVEMSEPTAPNSPDQETAQTVKTTSGPSSSQPKRSKKRKREEEEETREELIASSQAAPYISDGQQKKRKRLSGAEYPETPKNKKSKQEEDGEVTQLVNNLFATISRKKLAGLKTPVQNNQPSTPIGKVPTAIEDEEPPDSATSEPLVKESSSKKPKKKRKKGDDDDDPEALIQKLLSASFTSSSPARLTPKLEKVKHKVKSSTKSEETETSTVETPRSQPNARSPVKATTSDKKKKEKHNVSVMETPKTPIIVEPSLHVASSKKKKTSKDSQEDSSSETPAKPKSPVKDKKKNKKGDESIIDAVKTPDISAQLKSPAKEKKNKKVKSVIDTVDSSAQLSAAESSHVSKKKEKVSKVVQSLADDSELTLRINELDNEIKTEKKIKKKKEKSFLSESTKSSKLSKTTTASKELEINQDRSVDDDHEKEILKLLQMVNPKDKSKKKKTKKSTI